MKTKEICKNFKINGDFISAEPLGNGHINQTLLVKFKNISTEDAYVFQKINNLVFKEPIKLMDNYYRVSQHLRDCIDKDNSLKESRNLDVVLTKQDTPCHHNIEDDTFWRCYKYIDNAETFDVAENTDQAYQAAKTFAKFLKLAKTIPGGRLYETIPDFHNTPKRIEQLENAMQENPCDRLKLVEKEIQFILDRKEEAGTLVQLLKEGKLTEQITHNDTKINNALLDTTTGEGVCVIDLDTVMPGLIHYDFGDMIRSGAASANENEKNLSKVYMNFEMYSAILHGFLEEADEFLTPLDKELLPLSAKIITLEIGTRFLTDYLLGDEYFKIHYSEENLDRTRTQLKLVASIEQQFDKMKTELNKK
jgi:thiamine kinase-like enzyme